MTAYYNEIDPYCVQWLKNLMDAGVIAKGVVDDRSIEDVKPNDIRGFTQCHFFAGIGVWSHALRSAGWPDSRPVWTGSCPCQPFSAAGKGGGFTDERHLWPAWNHLIRECRPDEVFGEQVASKDGLNWLDLVWTDMEAEGYAFAPFDLCAAGVGAPEIRQRLFFAAQRMADPKLHGCDGATVRRSPCTSENKRGLPQPQGRSPFEWLASTSSAGLERQCGNGVDRKEPRWDDTRQNRPVTTQSSTCGLANATRKRQEQLEQLGICRAEKGGAGEGDRCGNGAYGGVGDTDRNGRQSRGSSATSDRHGGSIVPNGGVNGASPLHGFWRDADWLFCRDGYWRPVKSSTFPLAHGVANRVGRLRAYGNAIVAPLAQTFIESYLEVQNG